MTVERICSRSIDTALWGDTVQTAAQRMNSRNVGSLVVVDTENRPIGMLTDRDLAVRIVGESRDATQTKVGEVMTPAPRTVNEQADVEAALRLMRAGPCRRMPVVNDAGVLVGLISLDDILQSLAGEFRGIDQLLQHESPGSLASINVPAKVCL